MAILLASGTATASQTLPFNQTAVKQSTAPAALGPNPANPYFAVRFALPIPPENDKLRGGSMVGVDAAVADHHNSPAFEIMPNGDALMISYSGPSGREGGPETLMMQTRLRYGAEEFDMPEHVSVGGKSLIELLKADGQRVTGAPPLLWREGSTVWMFMGGHHFQGMPQPPGDPRPGGFRVFKSMDNGATWEVVALEPTFSALSADSQPITNAFRAPNGDMYVATDGMNGAYTSGLWRSSNGGLSWTDMGGRTSGRHSTIVPLDTSGSLLSFGGKDTRFGNTQYMPRNTSSNWGATWSAPTQSPFPWLGANQRPSMIRLASGNLVMVGDSRFIHNPNTTPSGWTHGDAPYVALSTDNGEKWTIKALPVALRHDWALHKTVGYTTVRQAPNGVIHILAVNCHPGLHYELNEAWITSTAGDIAPQTTGGTVQSYSETHPGGAPKATWSARRTTGGRYLLDGVETHFYADGKKQREVTWASGRRTGPETLWGPDGTRIWSWNHDLANNVSTWTHWWSNGQKRLESQWNTNPVARDLPTRNFRGLVANGTARHWNPSGQQTGQFAFLNGDRIFPLGNHSERFATDPGGRNWTGSNNTTNGNNFGWSSTTSHANNGNRDYMTDKGEIGGVFARSSTYRWFADTNIGTRNRTQTLRMSGIFNVANVNFDGAFRIGYFNTSGPANNFIGLEIREPTGTIIDPLLYGSGTRLRAYLTVNGPGGTSSSLPLELDGGQGKAFDLIWRGNSDGSGTLSGSVQSIPLPAITVGAGTSNFNAFGLLNGGAGSNNATEVTGSCWFDNLVYDKGTVTTHTVTYNANGGAGSVPSAQTKPSGVNIPVSSNVGNLTRSGFTFAGWNTAANGGGTNYAPGALYTANANTTLYARWTAATTYNVTYNANSATGGTAPATQIKNQDVALALATNSGNLARTGFAFAGWNTAANGTGTDYEPGQNYAANANLALHAKWAAISTKTLRIMPMGDSITAGTVPGGYRLPLYNLLQGGGYTFDFVGNKSQSGDTTPDTNHWGQGGWQISKTPVTIDGRSYVSIGGRNRSGIYEEMSSAISTTYFSTNTSTTRNIILLHIGINDILHQAVDSRYGSFNTDTDNNGYGEGQQWVAEGNIVRLQALLNSINSLATSRNLRIDVILGTLCPLTKAWTGDPVSDVLLDEVAQYNSFIRTVVPTMSFTNLNVTIVDQNTPTVGKLSDGLHPNGDGYAAMAQVWYNALGSPATSVVTFDAQGGIAPSPGNKTVTVGTAYGALPTTTRSGHTFAGWWTGTGGAGTEVTATSSVSNTSNHTLYAKWTGSSSPTYSVTYNANGATSGTAPASQIKTQDVALTLATNSGNLARTGYTFAGWNTAADGTGTNYAAGASYTGNANLSLFARWTANTYTVTYNANSATSGTAPASQAKTHDVALTLATNSGNLVRTGFNFAGWNTAADGSGTNYAVGASYTGNANLALFARWTTATTYTVTYNANGATSGTAPASQTKTQDVALTLATNIGNLARSGFAFAGWNTAADGSGTNYAEGASYTGNANLALFARWTTVATYTVTYNANGATSGTAPASQTKTQDVALTLATNSGNLARTGFAFSGWNTLADGRGTNYAAGATYTGNANLALFAKWTPESSGSLYWDNTGGTANDWGSTANWSTVVGGGSTPAVLPAASDVVTFSATPIAGTAQTVNLNGNRSVLGLAVTPDVSANTTLLGGGTNRALTIGSAGISNAGSAGISIGSGTTGQQVAITFAGSQSIAANGSGGIAIINNVSGTGSPTITNNGSGTGYINLSGALQATVGKLVQDSATSVLSPRGNNINFTGNIEVLKGTLAIGTGANNLGSGTSGQVILGGTGSDPATIEINDNANITYNARPIVLGTSSGTLKIVLRDEGGGSYTHTITGGVTGANHLTLESRASGTEANSKDDKLTFATGVLNNAGTITHIGDSEGDLTINAVIGSNVTGVIQDSATSRLVLGGLNTYGGDTIVKAGTLAVNGTAIPDTGKLVIHEGGKVAPSGATETVGSLFFSSVQQAAGTWGATGSGASNINDTYFTGTGVVSVTSGPSAPATYTITYNANGATSGTAPASQTKTHDVALTLATNSGNLARTGFTFAGWNTAADGTGIDYAEEATYTGNEDLSLFARWTQVPSGGEEVTETFDTAAMAAANGWTGSGNTAGGNNFGWNSTDVVLGAGTGGAAGGIFARTVSLSHFADTAIGTFDRTATLRLAGSLRLANNNFDGTFRLGYFTPGEGVANFVGIQIAEPSGGAGNPFRGYAGVSGTGGAATGMIELTQNTTLSFDLTWTGNPDGSGTLSGTLAGQSVNVPVGAGTGTFTAFGLLNGGAASNGSTLRTAGCYFDSLTYTSGTADALFEQWAGGPAMGFNDDMSGDGVSNGMAFLLGAPGPEGDAHHLLPAPAKTIEGLTLSFKMRDAESRGSASMSVEYSSDLVNWTTVPMPEASGESVDGVLFDINGSGLHDVKVTIPSGKAAGGKLYARLKADQ